MLAVRSGASPLHPTCLRHAAEAGVTRLNQKWCNGLVGKMNEIIEVETSRLILRQWKETDFTLFSEMNSDKKVMEFYPSILSEEQSNKMAERCKALIEQRGWGFWALEEKESNRFIGFTGLHIPNHDFPFSPCVEIGWRLSPSFWGHGLVTEAAREALRVGFEVLDLSEIVSFAVVSNKRSLAVMERLNMVKEQNIFNHPALPKGHKLQEHSLYRLSKTRWVATAV